MCLLWWSGFLAPDYLVGKIFSKTAFLSSCLKGWNIHIILIFPFLFFLSIRFLLSYSYHSLCSLSIRPIHPRDPSGFRCRLDSRPLPLGLFAAAMNSIPQSQASLRSRGGTRQAEEQRQSWSTSSDGMRSRRSSDERCEEVECIKKWCHVQGNRV